MRYEMAQVELFFFSQGCDIVRFCWRRKIAFILNSEPLLYLRRMAWLYFNSVLEIDVGLFEDGKLSDN